MLVTSISLIGNWFGAGVMICKGSTSKIKNIQERKARKENEFACESLSHWIHRHQIKYPQNGKHFFF